MKVRKIPPDAEAWRWDESEDTLRLLINRGLTWLSNNGHRDSPGICTNLKVGLFRGPTVIELGDYLVKDHHGRWWSYDHTVFHACFEIIEHDDS